MFLVARPPRAPRARDAGCAHLDPLARPKRVLMPAAASCHACDCVRACVEFVELPVPADVRFRVVPTHPNFGGRQGRIRGLLALRMCRFCRVLYPWFLFYVEGIFLQI